MHQLFTKKLQVDWQSQSTLVAEICKKIPCGCTSYRRIRRFDLYENVQLTVDFWTKNGTGLWIKLHVQSVGHLSAPSMSSPAISALPIKSPSSSTEEDRIQTVLLRRPEINGFAHFRFSPVLLWRPVCQTWQWYRLSVYCTWTGTLWW